VALLSISIEILVHLIDKSNEYEFPTFMALSFFRIFRVFKIISRLTIIQKIAANLREAVVDFRNFFILLIIFNFGYSIVGITFFKNQIRFNSDDQVDSVDGTSYKFNYDSLPAAMVTSFILIVADDWNEIMYQYIRATSFSSAFFFVSIVMIGNMILLNLFLAILLSNFEEAFAEKTNLQNRSEKKRWATVLLKKIGAPFKKALAKFKSRFKCCKCCCFGKKAKIGSLKRRKGINGSNSSQDFERNNQFSLNINSTSAVIRLDG